MDIVIFSGFGSEKFKNQIWIHIPTLKMKHTRIKTLPLKLESGLRFLSSGIDRDPAESGTKTLKKEKNKMHPVPCPLWRGNSSCLSHGSRAPTHLLYSEIQVYYLPYIFILYTLLIHIYTALLLYIVYLAA